MRTVALSLALAMTVLTSAKAVAHDGPHDSPDEVTFRVGKNGQFNLRQDVKVGPFLVKRGKYLFEHRLDADRHVIVLTEVARKDGGVPMMHELRTRLVPARKAAKRTSLYAKEQPDRSLVVMMVEVAGEQGEHVPQS